MPSIKSYFSVAGLLLFFLCVAFPVFGDDYQIGSGDVLTISVYDYEEMTSKVRVSENGNIEFPLIGKVQVGGLKISTAAKTIEELLADGYIINPQVSIFIDEFKSKKAIIIGQIKKPGLIELRGPTTLLELISQAGGLTPEAGETVTIKRIVQGDQEIINIDLVELIESGIPSKNIQINGGDTVSIAKGAVCYITGEVNSPGAYPCGRDTTILKIISMAGSFTGIASESSVKIHRVVDGKRTVLKRVNLNAPVQADDIIVVPESFF